MGRLDREYSERQMKSRSNAASGGRPTPPVVAIINSNDDLVQVLRDALIGHGFEVVTAHIRDIKQGRQDFSAFLRSHNPAVVVYDIAVPYEEGWTFFQTLRELPEAQSQLFVVTTVNKRVLDQRIGPNEAIEIQGGHADDLDPVIEAVQQVLKVRVG